jgi:hypothetical protein
VQANTYASQLHMSYPRKARIEVIQFSEQLRMALIADSYQTARRFGEGDLETPLPHKTFAEQEVSAGFLHQLNCAEMIRQYKEDCFVSM